jgi:hypothetical protein
MTNDELYNKLIDIACDTSCIRDMCKFKGDTDSPVYRRADDATNKVQALLDIIEKKSN